MILEREVLSRHTTFRIGGEARYFADVKNEAELVEALAFANEHKLKVAVLGGGSNTLVPDAGIDGLVIKVSIEGIEFTGERVRVGAGVSWDAFVRAAAARSLWGIENLAGIPGTVGGAVVQNIGAYGAELSEVCIETECAGKGRISKDEAQFAYRDSIFKHKRDLIITHATFLLSSTPAARLTYADLAKAKEAGAQLTTPTEIGEAVRVIRSKKFPDLTVEGTAGSFFKNPIISEAKASELKAIYPELPTYPAGEHLVKISLAWVLDHVLSLRGYRVGSVRLFENQPLVLVASNGARAEDIEQVAREIVLRVEEKIGITIEREVETISLQ